MSFSIRPFKLDKHLTLSQWRLDATPWIGAACVALGFLALSSVYIFAPGLTTHLPKAHLAAGRPCSAVLTITATGLYFFEDKVCSAKSLQQRLLQAVKRSPSVPQTLLVKADSSVEAGQLMHVFEMARAAGYAHIQWACFPEVPEK